MKESTLTEKGKIHQNKFNPGFYEVIERILSTNEFDSKMYFLIENAHLTQTKNSFLIKAKHTPNLSREVALKLAFNWREITKQFMFTVMTSLGEVVDKISPLNFPREYTKSSLEPDAANLSNDLNPDGLCSIWWEKNILDPLRVATNYKNLDAQITVSPKTRHLVQEMNKLALHPLGFAVQFYVVESLAGDIILALLALFTKIEVNGQKMFKSSEVFSWVTAHLQDETLPYQRKTPKDKEILSIFSTIEDQKDLFQLTQAYIKSWSNVLDEFYGFLDREPTDYFHELFIAFENRTLK